MSERVGRREARAEQVWLVRLLRLARGDRAGARRVLAPGAAGEGNGRATRRRRRRAGSALALADGGTRNDLRAEIAVRQSWLR